MDQNPALTGAEKLLFNQVQELKAQLKISISDNLKLNESIKNMNLNKMISVLPHMMEKDGEKKWRLITDNLKKEKKELERFIDQMGTEFKKLKETHEEQQIELKRKNTECEKMEVSLKLLQEANEKLKENKPKKEEKEEENGEKKWEEEKEFYVNEVKENAVLRIKVQEKSKLEARVKELEVIETNLRAENKQREKNLNIAYEARKNNLSKITALERDISDLKVKVEKNRFIETENILLLGEVASLKKRN